MLNSNTPKNGDEMKKISEILEMMNDSKLNDNAEHAFRIKVEDFEHILGLDLEGNVLYTRIEYPMCTEEIMVEMEG